jgi:hypothetical protein
MALVQVILDELNCSLFVVRDSRLGVCLITSLVVDGPDAPCGLDHLFFSHFVALMQKERKGEQRWELLENEDAFRVGATGISCGSKLGEGSTFSTINSSNSSPKSSPSAPSQSSH